MGSNQYKITISTEAKGGEQITRLRTQLETLGRIKAFAQLKKQAAGSKKAFAEATARVSALAREMRAAEAPSRALTRDFERAKKQAARLKSTWQANEQKLQGLRRALKSAGVDTRRFASAQKDLERETRATQKILSARARLNVRPYKEIRHEIQGLKRDYRLLKRSGKLSHGELYRAQVQLRKKTAELRAETGGWANSLTHVGRGLLAMAGIGYGLAKAFGAYKEYTQRMAEVNSLLDVSRARYQALSKEILGLSTRIPQTASELAAAEYDIISAGVKLADSTKVLELSAKAAVAGVTDTKTAVRAGLGVINAYGMRIGKLGHVYDVLFETVKLGVTTFPELADEIGNVLPTARAAGVRFEEVAAAIAAMTKAGIRTPIAVTALRGAINALSAPTDAAKKRFADLGITWKGLIPTLAAIREKGLSIDQMRDLIPDVRARTAVLTLTQNFDQFKKTLGLTDRQIDALAKAFDKMKDTPENQLKELGNQFTLLEINLGHLLSAGIMPVVKALNEFLPDLGHALQYAFANIDKFFTGLEIKWLKVKKIIEEAGSLSFADTSGIDRQIEAARRHLKVIELTKRKIVEEGAAQKRAAETGVKAQQQLRRAALAAARALHAPSQAVEASGKALDSFARQARAAYRDATREAKTYAANVKRLKRALAGAEISDKDQIRELNRRLMTEEDAWNDRRKQAAEKLSAAKRALAENDFKLSARLMNESKRLYAGLATEVKKTDDKGKSVVAQSLEDSITIAKQGLAQVSDFRKKLYDVQIKDQQQLQKDAEKRAGQIKAALDAIVRDRKAHITIELERVHEAANEINALIRDETKKIKIEVVREVKTVQKHAAGGLATLAAGGRLAGYGGGDRIRALLEAGEYVVRKEAVRKYGAGLLDAINNLRLPDLGAIVSRQLAAFDASRLRGPALGFAAGGPVPTEAMTINLRAGSAEMPLTVAGPPAVTRQMVRAFEAELRKMGLSHG